MNPNDPLSWIFKADQDLALVRELLPQSANFPGLLCYHCQQAAEKYLKALLLHHNLSVRRTHDLEELVDVLVPHEPRITAEHYNKALRINAYSILTRYPSIAGDPTPQNVQEAFAAAEFFRAFAVEVLGF